NGRSVTVVSANLHVHLCKTIMRYLSIAFLSIVNIAFGQQATVKGTLPAKFTGKSVSLTLINYETRKDKKVQETNVAAGGFTFTIPVTEPAIYNLSLGDSTLLQILTKPGANITLKINSDGIVATGSQETQYLIAY